jgi:hypothetical protein
MGKSDVMRSEDIIKLLGMQPLPGPRWGGEFIRYEWSAFHGEMRPAVYTYCMEDRKKARRMLDVGCTDLDEIAAMCGNWAMKV